MATITVPGMFLTGDHASRPAATAVGGGSVYSCTDHALIYQSDGASWSTWATLGTTPDAADVPFTPAGTIAATDVQAAIEEVASEAASGAGLTFTPMNRVTVFSGATTTSTIARTLTSAITGVPADAVAVSGYAEIATSSALQSGSFLGLYHTSGGTNDFAVLIRAIIASNVPFGNSFVCGVVQSSGAKLSYTVNRAADTVTYSVFVTGYWAPA